MSYKDKNFFFNVWKDFLNESLTFEEGKKLDLLKNDLIKTKNEIFSEDYSNWSQENFRQDRYHEFLVTVEKRSNELGLEIKGEGAQRVVFFIRGVEDVILKIANGIRGVRSNSKEINVSKSDYGSGSRKVFTKLYDYDLEENPVWIFAEKVGTIYDEGEEVATEILYLTKDQINKVLPTISAIFREDLNPHQFVSTLDLFLKSLANHFKQTFGESFIPSDSITSEYLIEAIENMADDDVYYIDYTKPEYKLDENGEYELDENGDKIKNDRKTTVYSDLKEDYDFILERTRNFPDIRNLLLMTGENFYHDFSLANIGIDKSDLENNSLSPESLKILDLTYTHDTYDAKVYKDPQR